MMVAAGVPHGEFKGIRVGDFLFEDEIIHLYKSDNYMKICTKSGAVYTVHYKPWGYNVFRRTKVKQRKRQRKYEANIMPGVCGDMDAIGRFLRDRCVLKIGVSVREGELFAGYQKWCGAWKEHPCTEGFFKLRLEEMGFEREDGCVWQGIGMK
jgi:hypothetical protein